MRIATRSDGKRVSCSLYNIWHSMRLRCLTPGYRDYKYYGGRGITICEAWGTYEGFREWAIANGFRKAVALDRVDPDGNYCPNNCRWTSRNDYQLNTRRVLKLTVAGITKPLPVWARLKGLSSDLIRTRLYSGWSHDRAVLTPLGAPRPVGLKYRPRQVRV